MIAFVTGATGFVGSHVADELVKRGYTVRCLTRPTSSLQWLEGTPVERAIGSLGDIASLTKAVEGADIVVHVAGLTAARNREEFFQGNQVATRNLIEAARKAAPNLKRFLHVSSQAAVGPSSSLEQPVNEDTQARPITAYGESKKASEDEVFAAKDSFPVTVVRPPAVFGQRDTAIFSFFKTVGRMGILPLMGFNTKYLSLIHCYDLARGIVDAAESPNTVGKAYFVASEELYTWEQIAECTRKAFGSSSSAFKIRLPEPVVMGVAGVSEFFGKFSSKPPVFNYEKGKDFIQDYWTCSVERAKQDFGYRQQVSLQDGITQTVEWYIANKWL
jgi:dihydroflavonol-4-reductase